MRLGEKETRALRPNAQAFDEVRIKTVPRYKTSGMSGDEWRISASIQFFRHGILRHEIGVRDVETACGMVYGELMKAQDNALGYFGGEGDFCDQEGCAATATITRYLKKEFCRQGHGVDVTRPTFRRFCEDHKTRGDCGLEDADDNYTEHGTTQTN